MEPRDEHRPVRDASEDGDHHRDQPAVAELLAPGIPADHGLSSLGLIMQLGGTIYMILMAFMALWPVVQSAYLPGGGGPGMWALFLACALGAVRSAFHRAAGTSLLYGSAHGPFLAVRNYIIIGLVHAGLLPLMLKSLLPLGAVLPLMVMAAAWPVTVAVIVSLPRYRMIRTSIPFSPDLGVEGSAVLMSLLGVIGAIAMGLALLLMFQARGAVLGSLEGVLLVCVVGMLLVRSILHALAGRKGLGGTTLEHATTSAASYFSFGVTSAFIAGGSLLLIALVNGMPFLMTLATVAFVVSMLLAWPLILRRFYSERNYTVVLGGDDAPAFHRAPDRGLTALGWLLLALSVMDLSSALAGIVFPTSSSMGGMGLISAGALAEMFDSSPWWTVLVSGLQLWAAIELITMSDRYKLATIAYGAAAAVIRVLVILWPLMNDLDQLSRGLGRGMAGLGENMGFGLIALALVVPIGAVFLVLRDQAPAATARFRRSAAGHRP